MAANYYADFLSGNDANDGESWGNAVQHISKAVELVAALGTITEGITVWLKGTLAAPQTYTETSGKVDLSRLVFGPDGSLTFKTEVFNTTNYASGDADPYNASDGAGDWNPKADKPVTVPPFDIEKCKNVEFYGIAFMSTNASTGRAAAEVTEYSEVRMHYCAAEEGVVGFLAAKYSTLELYNVYAHDCRIGAAGIEFANLKVIGENFIEDNLRIGVLGWQNALVSFEAWEDDPTKYVTTIKTATPILKYYGILIRMNSTMDIRDAIFVDDDTDIAHVKILNGTAYKSDQYYGLAAESGSVATGIENLSFADANILDGKDTILEANQVVVTGGAATVK
ncbi:MAG: hypothetical protein M5R36_28645 [Deltaproteobacteria bacterium]|nr:hypothetical protein [Deltaproteobacteria bacterium]